MVKFFTFLLFLAGFSTVAFSQVTLVATASATVVTPINMSKIDDMNFGNLAVTTLPGTVILTPSGSRTLTGGVTLPSTTGSVSAAEFIVTGVPHYTYSILLPPSVILTNSVGSGGETMMVDTFTSDPAPTGQLGTSGMQNLNIGATVHVSANQANGIYVSIPPFNVTVNYN